ncbi:hypothetical protein [Hoeflea sp.]|uniref:hypothetical protein n=1 Tax=Hoeflea sp. TaxID=1940281 RepID=UPI0019B6990E|nr:hypothetical protein [Hoeflea sp.]MBC7284549.1 hypothetical protein [Hoeflea sp.]
MFRTHSRSLVLSAALLLGPAQAAIAQSADPAWLDNLSSQLAVQEDCAVDYYLNIKEGQLAGRLTFEARAQCADGRQFDASLIEPAEEFTISECGVQVC